MALRTFQSSLCGRDYQQMCALGRSFLANPFPTHLHRTISISCRLLSDPPQPSSTLKYSVQRTPSNNLPVYQLTKNGGNKKLTKIRRVEGDLAALRDEIREVLGLAEKECILNQLTGQIILKGHRKAQISKFLEERNF